MVDVTNSIFTKNCTGCREFGILMKLIFLLDEEDFNKIKEKAQIEDIAYCPTALELAREIDAKLKAAEAKTVEPADETV